jgi:hypothetical protein
MFRKIAVATLILTLVGVSIYVLLGTRTSTFDIIVAVAKSIREDVQPSLTQYKQDLALQKTTYYQWNVTAEGIDATVLRDELIAFRKRHNIKGCVLVGTFPSAMWEDTPGMLPDNQYPTDQFYMDLDGRWRDTDGNGAYDAHDGNTRPEIWVGRIHASPVDGDEAELINRYFTKNHHYRTTRASPPWPQQALAYIDNGILASAPIHGNRARYYAYVETTTDCLQTLYGPDVEVIYDTFEDSSRATADDYRHRLTASEGYEWVWVYGHGYQWPPPSCGHHTFTPGSDVYWAFYLHEAPKAFFYLWDVCEAATFHQPNCLASSAILGNGWGLVSLGMTSAGYPQAQFSSFFSSLEAGECVGAAFLTLWGSFTNQYGSIAYEEHKKWTILGDPTLLLK